MRISDWSSDVCSSDLALAFHVSGVILWFIGVDPVFAVEVILYGAFGYDLAIGYTLYYTSNFVFTGLAVAAPFHAGLFNIGGEGQAYIGVLGAPTAILAVLHPLLFSLLLPLDLLHAAALATAWHTGRAPGPPP